MPKQKYDLAYIKYGFITMELEGEALLQCAVCMKLLSNMVMKCRLLKHHPETDHMDMKDQDQSYSQRLGENMKQQHLNKTGLS